jgi:dTDP-glucose 4,6-dehydratase
VRDWLHVEDHCAALDLVLRRGAPGEVYNIGSGHGRENLDVLRRLLALVGRGEELLEPVADRPGHDRRYAVACAKIGTLGWAPRVGFDEGLAAAVAWWRAILSGEYRSWYQRNYGGRAARVGG